MSRRRVIYDIFKGEVKTHSLGAPILTIVLMTIVLMPAAILVEAQNGDNQTQVPEQTIPAIGQENGTLDQSNKTNDSGHDAINLSNNTGGSAFESLLTLNNRGYMAASDSNVYVVWSDNSTSLGSIDIMLAKSEDKGVSFHKPQDLSFPLRNNGSVFGLSTAPQIAVTGNNVFVVWTEFTYAQTGMNLDEAIMYVRSTDGGKSFEGPFSITSSCFGIPESTNCISTVAYNARIIASGDFAYVAWNAYKLLPAFVTTPEFPRDNVDIASSTPSDIFYSKIGPSGSTVPLNISNNTGESLSPRIALSGSNVYVAWADDSYGLSEILLKRISDNGTTSESETINVSNSLSTKDNMPELVASGSNLYFTWQQSGRDRSGIAKNTLVFASSQDNGTTFSNPVTIATTKISAVIGPGQSMAVRNFSMNDNTTNNSDSRVQVVWTDGTLQGQNVYFAGSNSTRSGAYPSPSLALTNNTEAVPNAQLAVTPNGVHLAWTQKTPLGSAIFFSESNFTSSTANTTGGTKEEGSAMIFSPPINVSNSTGTLALNPIIISNGDNVYLAWNGKSTVENWDIFFKKMH